jgi:hypothetical protein
MVQAPRSVQWASANKSSLATIFANPIYRGVKVFNRETRVEGEHGRKRRRNPQQDVVTSEVEAIVPEQLWSRRSRNARSSRRSDTLRLASVGVSELLVSELIAVDPPAAVYDAKGRVGTLPTVPPLLRSLTCANPLRCRNM